jgi:hypothetical protein
VIINGTIALCSENRTTARGEPLKTKAMFFVKIVLGVSPKTHHGGTPGAVPKAQALERRGARRWFRSLPALVIILLLFTE